MDPAIDYKDRLLMELLRDNARITNRRLAQRIGLSPSACLARVKRLEKGGYLVAYRAVVAHAGAGHVLEGWAGVRITRPSAQATEHFLRLITLTPEVIEAHRIAGHFDYTLRFCAGDLEVWNDFRRHLEALEIEVEAHLSILIETLK